jgi:hypothetical protein
MAGKNWADVSVEVRVLSAHAQRLALSIGHIPRLWQQRAFSRSVDNRARSSSCLRPPQHVRHRRMLAFADDAALARLVIAAAQRRSPLPASKLSDRAVRRSGTNSHGKVADGYCFSVDVIYACWFYIT